MRSRNQLTDSVYINSFLSLGSNLGERDKNIRIALDYLESCPKTKIVRVSEFYETEPKYYIEQDNFINCAVKISTGLMCNELLVEIRKIENKLGRTWNGIKYGPRTIDIDIIFYGRQVINTKDLQIPHSRYFERKFVLVPLNEIAPDFVCPKIQKSVQNVLAGCNDKSFVARYGEIGEMI